MRRRRAIRRRRCGALEELARDADQRYRVAVILEPVYRGAGDLGKLVGALEAQLESVDDRSERVRLLREMADIHQRLGRLDLAFENRSRAWLADVESAETLAEMESFALSPSCTPGWWRRCRRAPSRPPIRICRRALGGLGRLLESPLGQSAEAIEAWRSALAAKPDDREAFLALERLLSGAVRPAELVEVLERHFEVTVDAEERKAIAKRIAVLYEDALKQREQAVRAWETVLEIDPNEAEALESLAQLHLQAGDFRELAGVYRAQDRADRTRRRTPHAVLAERAHLRREARRAGAAIDQLRALLAETPGDGEALADLDRIFTAEGRPADLLEVLDARARALETSARGRAGAAGGAPRRDGI